MKALTWQGKRQIGYDEMPDPRIQEPDRRSTCSIPDFSADEVMEDVRQQGQLRHAVVITDVPVT
ncbi:hypothetical protein AB0E69_33815 [Kribbella sp. NPDC026611]|uniref:hypothetical protein n=1 Tax=Kribbella sp. NPDC026611 TaxID=3154911 RepID=UPI0033C41DBF